MISSVPSSCRRKYTRTSSRSRRFSWFRSTAERRCLGTTNPTRAIPREWEASPRSSRSFDRTRFPSCRTIWSSFFPVSRELRGKPSFSGASVLGRKLYRQPLPSLLATSAENFSSPLIRHARPEAVCLHPTLITRPVCWLTHDWSARIGAELELSKPVNLTPNRRYSKCINQRMSTRFDFSTELVYVRPPVWVPPFFHIP